MRFYLLILTLFTKIRVHLHPRVSFLVQRFLRRLLRREAPCDVPVRHTKVRSRDSNLSGHLLHALESSLGDRSPELVNLFLRSLLLNAERVRVC